MKLKLRTAARPHPGTPTRSGGTVEVTATVQISTQSRAAAIARVVDALTIDGVDLVYVSADLVEPEQDVRVAFGDEEEPSGWLHYTPR